MAYNSLKAYWIWRRKKEVEENKFRALGANEDAIRSHTHAAEVVLRKCDRRAGKGKVPRFQTGLCKGNVTTHSLRFPFGKIQRDHTAIPVWISMSKTKMGRRDLLKSRELLWKITVLYHFRTH